MTRAIRYAIDYVVNPARLLRRPSLPRNLNLPITDNCNSRCVMCDVWKEPSAKDLSQAELGAILADPFFAKVRHVGISGGEPTLRRDLVEVVDVILDRLERLQSLSITTHGFLVRRWEQFLPAIKDRCDTHGVGFTLNISVDGRGEVHDLVRQIPGGFAKTQQTRALAGRLGVPVQFHMTVLEDNVYDVGRVADLAREEGATPIFRQATVIDRLDNRESMSHVALDPAERSFFADFLRSRRALGGTASPPRRLFYRDLAKRLVSGGDRKAPCYFQREGVVLSPSGQLWHCSICEDSFGNALETSALELHKSRASVESRRKMLSTLCAGCVHDQSGAWSPLNLGREVIRESRLGRFMTLAWRAVVLGVNVMRTLPAIPLARRGAAKMRMQGIDGALGRVVVLGAYGGEHVGDSAILGGVLIRLHDEFGVGSADVISTRPDRTAVWISGLQLPIDVRVLPADRASRRAAVEESDAVVWAGGPIMEMPETLATHLATVVFATRRMRPFFIEGVGIGPFRTFVGRWLARQILRLATRTQVRSRADQAAVSTMKLEANVVDDPSYAYLASRDVAKLRTTHEGELEGVFAKLDGQDIVGVNLRPMWSKYMRGGTDPGQLDGVVVRRVAEGLAMFIEARKASGRNSSVVIFPMNADEYGFSDLAIGDALLRALPPQVTACLLERELLVDEVLWVMRRCSSILTMRFHGAIFARSQGVPTVGLDYQIGSRGKVGRLFDELGDGHLAIPIMDLTPDALCRALDACGGQREALV